MPHVNDLHEQHDPILVVSLASGDLATADRDRATAQSLVDTCADCARLHDDVLALAVATKALPPAVRTRDFRLTPEQAAQLQPRGWRRFFTAPGAVFSRQLGVGLTTLGNRGDPRQLDRQPPARDARRSGRARGRVGPVGCTGRRSPRQRRHAAGTSARDHPSRATRRPGAWTRRSRVRPACRSAPALPVPRLHRSQR